jgi:hypothetical protein
LALASRNMYSTYCMYILKVVTCNLSAGNLEGSGLWWTLQNGLWPLEETSK